MHVVRCSVGRSGDVAVLQRDDEDLAALAAAELAGAIGDNGEKRRAAGHPLGRRPAPVQRRPPGPRRGDPRGRGAQPGLAVAGAAYDGVGIPACVATAKSAAAQVTAYLGRAGQRPRSGLLSF